MSYQLRRRGEYTFAYPLRANGKRAAGKPRKVCPICFTAEKGGGVLMSGEEIEYCSAGCGYTRVAATAKNTTG